MYARYIPDIIKIKQGQFSSAFNSSNPKYAKNFNMDRDTMEINIYIRYEQDEIRVLVKGARAQSPEPLYKVIDYFKKDIGAKSISSFYMTVSASTSDSFVGVKLPNLFFKTDKTNADVVYFEVNEYLHRTMNTLSEQMFLTIFITCTMFYPKKGKTLMRILT